MSQTRIFIGGLNPKCRESDLERFFAGYGRLKSMLLKRGYGFVEFEDSHDADDAVDSLNGTEMLGHIVQVQHATPRQYRRYPANRGWRGRGYFNNGRGRNGFGYNMRYQQKRGTGFRLLVKNLSSRVTWQELKDFMRQAGEVAYADVCGELNEGTVEYRFYGDLCRALDTLDNAELAGWKIKLVEETKGGYSKYRDGGKNWKGNNRSSSRSRSKSSSRSRSPIKNKKR